MKDIVYYPARVERVLGSFPEKVAQKFAADLYGMQRGRPPKSACSQLQGMPIATSELKKNGKPAYRLVYCFHNGKIFVVNAFKKTTNGSDTHQMDTVRKRLTELLQAHPAVKSSSNKGKKGSKSPVAKSKKKSRKKK